MEVKPTDSNSDQDSQESPSTIRGGLWRVIQLAIFLALAAFVATLFARDHWAFDLLANLRMQQLIGLAFLLFLCAIYRNWKWGLVLVLMIAFHLSWFSHAFPSKSSATEQNSQLVLTVSNVLTQNTQHDLVIADVTSNDADVIVILELSSALAEKLASELKESHPHSLVRPQDTGNFGIGLFSRYPIKDPNVFGLNYEIESITATINASGADFRVIATHPLPPVSERGFEFRNEHLRQLAARVADFHAAEPDTSVVVAGDLNVTPWSPIFSDFADDSGLHRAIDRFDMTPTWYRGNAFPFGLVLDHVMVSPEVDCVDHRVGSQTGSDHRSVTVTLLK